MGPLDLFAGGPPLLLAALVYMTTQLIKSIVDATMGREKRKSNKVLTRVVFPAIPPVIGALWAFVPYHPDTLVTFVTESGMAWWLGQVIYSAWGATCGQFADYLYSKVKKLVQS